MSHCIQILNIKIMNRIRVRFYIRIVLLLALIFVLLQSCYLNLSSTVKQSNHRAISAIPSGDHFDNSAANVPALRLFPENFNKNGSKIWRKVRDKNHFQTVFNEEQFGPLAEDAVVIVIQVHKRLNYLRQMIRSLFHASNISSTLLVFSHDFYDNEINSVVQAIDFCKVIQIFYPYSLQIHPHEFPGTDPNDCPPNVGDEKALKLNCNNAAYPDVHGHFRLAELTQMKHHWWWKANRVFDELLITKKHKGLVLFLEGDQYVSEDFLHMVKLMYSNSTQVCPHCNMLCLGNSFKPFRFSKVICSPWQSGLQSIAIAFNRSTWSNIRSCAQHFCTYDDYTWNWSLNHASENCLAQKLVVLSTVAARVYPIGDCKIESTNWNCKSRLELESVQRMMHFALKSGLLYPSSLRLIPSVGATTVESIKIDRQHGKWSDPRDHQLCLKAAQL